MLAYATERLLRDAALTEERATRKLAAATGGGSDALERQFKSLLAGLAALRRHIDTIAALPTTGSFLTTVGAAHTIWGLVDQAERCLGEARALVGPT